MIFPRNSFGSVPVWEDMIKKLIAFTLDSSVSFVFLKNDLFEFRKVYNII